ncbi:dihydroxyacetone kinase phosphoryl donor subunit DhaM [Arcanobacterium hippocoleae]
MPVSLVLVSHSQQLAAGLRELAAQMAHDVKIVAAGGLDDGGIGTSFDKINTAVGDLRREGSEVLILTDLGSATMTVESVLDFLDDERVIFVNAPFVEAAVAASAAAQGGKNLPECAQAARDSVNIFIADTSADIENINATSDYKKSNTHVQCA